MNQSSFIPYEDLSTDQKEVTDDILEWYFEKDEQIYALGGYAGTGKSTLIRTVSSMIEEEENYDIQIKYITYTGKASLVLSVKGLNATTIHSLIYEPVGEKELENGREVPIFEKREHIPRDIVLLIIDEISMVPQHILEDLKSYNVKILAVGDPGQLPPVQSDVRDIKENEIVREVRWNSVLNKIHRQAEGNPILRLASRIREGRKMLGWGKFKDDSGNTRLVISKHTKIDEKPLLDANQILLGFNRSRRRLNQKMRKWKGFTDRLPQEGDEVICIWNNWNRACTGRLKGSTKETTVNLVNGMKGRVVNSIRNYEESPGIFRMDFQPEFFSEGYFQDLLVSDTAFLKPVESDGEGTDKSRYIYNLREEMVNQFDYGYSVTTSKAQGSQWDNVVILNQNYEERSTLNHRRWLYTAVTRASKNLILFTDTLGYKLRRYPDGRPKYIFWMNYLD